MMKPEYMDKMTKELLEKIREHAFSVVAAQHVLTILPTEHGARVPLHWVVETDEMTASVLPSDALITVLEGRGYVVK